MLFFVFFFRKSLKICSGSNLLFRGLTFDFFSSFLLLKRRQTPISNSEKVKEIVSKVEFDFPAK